MDIEASRGETSAQTVILLPVLLLMLWVGVHVALLLHSGNVAAAVADVVARRAAVAGTFVGTVDDRSLGTLADAVAAELSAELTSDPVVRRAPDTVQVTVTVRGPHLVPFLPDRVTRSSTVPIEKFMTEEQRR